MSPQSEPSGGINAVSAGLHRRGTMGGGARDKGGRKRWGRKRGARKGVWGRERGGVLA